MSTGNYVVLKLGARFMGAIETAEEERVRCSALARFLEREQLVKRALTDESGMVPIDFCLRKDDLTPEGLALFKAALFKWAAAYDRSKDTSDIGVFERALAKFRKSVVN